MKILIFGAGYVGTVTGACLAKMGYQVLFIEPNPDKVNAISRGESPILEPQLCDLLKWGVRNQKIDAKIALETEDLLLADLAMIAVATPSKLNGELRLHYLQDVLRTIQKEAVLCQKKLIVAIRSTVNPLDLRQLEEEIKPEAKSLLSLVVNPEFLRESTAVHDFFNAPLCVAGSDDAASAHQVLDLYQQICPKRFAMGLESACLLKYSCNAFHALKIAFANEMGSICEALHVDPLELMDVFCEDHALNCSKAYLKPGFSFGGSCLPKDLRALVSLGKGLKEPLALLSSILPSNLNRFQKCFDEILEHQHKSLACVGLSFKKNNDDLRESPYLELVERLLGKGMSLKIYDPDVSVGRLTGSNRAQFERHFKHIIPLIQEDLPSTLQGVDGVILCKQYLSESSLKILEENRVPIYDLQYALNRGKVRVGHWVEELCTA